MPHFRTTAMLTLVAALALPAAAQTTSPDTATLQALLSEVRQLRLALERSASMGPKMQLTLQRVQMQQQKLQSVSLELDAVRREINGLAGPSKRAAAQIPIVEQALASESNPAQRKELEIQLAAVKDVAGRQVDPQLLAHESELASSVRVEQAVLDELNEKLNAIERLLDAPAPAQAKP